MTEQQTARILDGKGTARDLREETASEVRRFTTAGHAPPRLEVVLVGEDPASQVYVRNKAKACSAAGIHSDLQRLPSDISESRLLALIDSMNRRDEVDGILVQMPLPSHIDAGRVIAAVDPDKDVDGFHPRNVGRLWAGEPALVPCTPAGIIELLERSGIRFEGSEAVIIGRSDIVGKPMAALLLHRHATVTLCHSRTRNLPAVASRADILVAAIGRPAFVTGEFIRPGATVIDVGINQLTDPEAAAILFEGNPKRIARVREKGYTLVGDVHPAEAGRRAGAITPVPGGVGPLTIALLIRNTLQAAKARRGAR